MFRIGLTFVLMLLAGWVQAAPTIFLNNTTNQAYQLMWYIDVPDSHQVIRYQQLVPAHAESVPATPGVVYQAAAGSNDQSKQPVSVAVAAYAKGSKSQFADNTLAVKLYQGNQLINGNHFALAIELRDSGIAVFIKSLGTNS